VREAGSFDLVFVDPPTFSNSKRMAGTFDVQRDHVALLDAAAALLSANGTLVFSTNRRGFRLDVPALAPLQVHDWTAASIPPDFSRPAVPHRCWMLRHRPA
jgi:23S rRNA (guanine2445-N2)-methyltransferase / 23S rRNA (guanine2069-N7)-methyltransferase